MAPAKAPRIPLGQDTLESLTGERGLVLYFMREFGCSICMGHVLKLNQKYAELKSQGVELAVIAGGSQQDAEKFKARYKLPFPVLGDATKEAYRAYGLEKKALLIQQSGSFVVDKAGTLVYEHRSTSPTGALDEAALFDAVKSLAQN